MEEDEHTLEIEKTIPLLKLNRYKNAKELSDDLKAGNLTFYLTEALFNDDFPGHYCRKIKSIAFTIPRPL